MTTKNNFLLTGNGPCLNRGCEALLIGTTEILKKSFPDYDCVNAFKVTSAYAREEIADASMCKASNLVLHPHYRPLCRKFSLNWTIRQVKKMLGLAKYEYEFLFRKYLKNTKAILSLGGDNFTLDYGYPDYYIEIANFAKKHSIPFVIWGASVGPFSADKNYEMKIADFFKSISLITVRETTSLAYLNNLGIKDNVKLVTDPAFAMSPQKCSLPKDIEAILESETIGVNLSPLVGNYRNSPEAWLNDATAAVKEIAAMGYPVLLIPHVMVNVSNDYLFLKQIQSNVAASNVHLLEPLRAAEIKWVISRLKAFAGARTHATIASMSSCVPTISIGYSTKAHGLNLDIFGHANWLVDIKDFNANIITSKLRELLSQENDVRNQLKTVVPGYREKAYLGGEFLKDMLAQSGF